MDINETNSGASSYAMKKAMEMPKLVLSLLQQTPNSQSQSLNTESTAVKQAADLASIAGKGKLVNVIA